MSAVCDGCGIPLVTDGAFFGNCGRVTWSEPVWAGGSRPALTPAGVRLRLFAPVIMHRADWVRGTR